MILEESLVSDPALEYSTSAAFEVKPRTVEMIHDSRKMHLRSQAP